MTGYCVLLILSSTLAFILVFRLLRSFVNCSWIMSSAKRSAKKLEFYSGCKFHPNNICYVCGCLAPFETSHSISRSPSFQIAYVEYFGFAVGHQDKTWVPHVCCHSCYTKLINWRKGLYSKGMPFAVPVRWREPKCHFNDCYFCAVDFNGQTASQSQSWMHKQWPRSVSKPLLHSDDYPVPVSSNVPDENF